MRLTERLVALDACKRAVGWSRGRSAAHAWRECRDGSWLLWIAGRLCGPSGSPSRRLVVRAAAACARQALPNLREESLLCVMLALHLCDEYAAGRADAEDCRAAGDGAANAAWAAGDASWAARSAPGAAGCAAGAAGCAAGAAAWDASLRRSADIVRRIIPYREIARWARER